MSETVRAMLSHWHATGVQAVQGERLLPRFGRVINDRWRFEREQRVVEFTLPDRARGGRLRVIGLGKAALGMARGFRQSLWPSGVEIDDGFLIIRDAEPTTREEPWRVMVGDHPIPGAASERAARALLEFIGQSRAGDVCVVLLSGGASALCALPAPGVTLEEKVRVTRDLMYRGVPIAELNRARARLSAIKGGKLAERIAPARLCTLAISDVPGDDPAVIGSAPTLRLDVDAHSQAQPPYVVIATLDDALAAIAEAAAADIADASTPRIAPWEVITLGRCLYGSIRDETARVMRHLDELFDLPRSEGAGRVLLAGGEPLVEVRGGGRGGRAQEFALRLGLALAERAARDRRYATATGLVAGTDGSDGPTEAAGAFFDARLPQRVERAGLDPLAVLAASDSHAALRASGDLFVTGPTGTNVADVLMVAVPQS